MNEWYAGLAPRERLILGGAAVVVAVLLLVLAMRPIRTNTAALEERVADNQRLLVDLARAEGLGSGGARVAIGEELYLIADQTAKAHGLAIKNVRRDSPDVVRIPLDNVPFDSLTEWLVTLNNAHSADVENLTANSRERGIVSGNLVLRRH